MLYPTHHPSFCQFPSATSISLSSPQAPPPPPPLQVEPEMACVEAALKPSIRKEMALKSSQQVFFDDFCGVNVTNGPSFDDFLVDDYLDFSNENGLVEETEEEEKTSSVKEETFEEEEDNIIKNSDNHKTFAAKDDFIPVPAVPEDDLDNLEWLSQFVEDSNSEYYCSTFPACVLPEKPKTEEKTKTRSELPVQPTEVFFKTPVPAKARSKRTRTGVRIWPLGSPSLTESSSSSTSSSSSSSPTSPWLMCVNPTVEPVCFSKPPVKRQKIRKPAADGAQQVRRCSHCGVQKTPQWRAGPLGAKTLCNACGVRFKSGRLLPEYRPACSPTFSSELHSNHHRKVLEMRKKKELMGPADLAPVVRSF